MKYTFTLFTLLCFGIQISFAQTIGLQQYDLDQLEDNYILFSPNAFTSTYLINNCGEKVYEWQSAYRPRFTAYLLDNGNLIRAGRAPNSSITVGGSAGLVEIIAPDGTVLWTGDFSSTAYQSHHDIEPLPNGNFLVILWDVHSVSEVMAAGVPLATVDLHTTSIWEVQPNFSDNTYDIVWEWRAWDHLVQDQDPTATSTYGVVADEPGKIDLNFQSPINQDFLHCNSVEYNEERDEILLSMRAVGELWIIDHSTTTAEAATSSGGNRGKGGEILYRYGNPQIYDAGTAADQVSFGQHGAHWIPSGYPNEGGIIFFNNGTGRPEGDYSSADLIFPVYDASGNYVVPASGTPFLPTSPDDSYVAPNPTDFFSQRLSSTIPQPNGNILICEGSNGRIFEINDMDEIVWQYQNPVNNSGPETQGTVSNNGVFKAERIPADHPGLAFLDLTPKGEIEINPMDIGCDLTSSNIDTEIRELSFYPNPTNGQINFEGTIEGQISIYNLVGQRIITKEINNNSIDVSLLPKGSYVIEYFDGNKKQVAKLVKL